MAARRSYRTEVLAEIYGGLDFADIPGDGVPVSTASINGDVDVQLPEKGSG